MSGVVAAQLLGGFAALGGVSALGLSPGPKECLLPLPAAEAAGTARLPGLLARGRRPPHPPTLHMVIEALRAQDERKGASVIAIKRFILAKYPTVDPVRLKYLLKQALSKGLSRGDLVRPHNSSAMGATGRFKVSRGLLAPKQRGWGLRCCLASLPPLSHPQLAPKKLQPKQPSGQADPDGGQAPKLGRKGTTKPPRAPVAGVQQQGKGLVVPRATPGLPRPHGEALAWAHPLPLLPQELRRRSRQQRSRSRGRSPQM